ncbi:MAG TPA: DUF2085 domain-containing protein [Candidatus Angelobacter sp.]|nr:DUF2085 domain-containing protein [Candidatus Angelobacter sp.]
MDRKSKNFIQPIWAALIPLALAAVACTVPWLMAHAPELGFTLQRGFALVCHQNAERCFILFGGAVCVCARCLGIYLGAAAGLLFRVSNRLAWRLFVAAVAANLADGLSEFAGLHGNWMLARFALGVALGMAGALVVSSSVNVSAENPANSTRGLQQA